MNKKKLTPKELRLVDAMANDNKLSGTKAAIMAGYSEKGAYQAAHRALKKVEVQAALTERIRAIGRQFNISRESLMQELAAVAYCNVEDFMAITDSNGNVDWNAFDKLDKNLTKAVQEVTHTVNGGEKTFNQNTKIKMHNKLDAIKTLGQMCGYLEPDDDPKGNAKEQKVSIHIHGKVESIETTDEGEAKNES